jgi:hypothetical protein
MSGGIDLPFRPQGLEKPALAGALQEKGLERLSAYGFQA